MDTGDTIHVENAGNAGRHGLEPGSLFIKLKVESFLLEFVLFH